MKRLLGLVLQFQIKFGDKLNIKIENITEAHYTLRHKLMQEENNEYLEACQENNEVEIADALGDQLYILLGTINNHGMQHVIEDVFEEIHRSNMSKLGEDGKPIYRKDGKIMKGPNYFKPNIKKYLYGKD